MRSFVLSAVLCLGVASYVFADQIITSPGKGRKDKVLVIEQTEGERREIESPHLETITTHIVGSPSMREDRARDSWDAACQKKENSASRSKDFKNFDCGEPEVSTKTHQSETTYTVTSKAKITFLVGCGK